MYCITLYKECKGYLNVSTHNKKVKIIKKDLKKGEISVIVESKEDLWYLNYLIDPEDEIKGRTVRKIKE